jgi:hypothetical protein
LVIKTFSTKEILNVIKSIKSKDSRGYDEISTKILKISSKYIVSPVTYICNKIILLGIFPDRLKSNQYTRNVIRGTAPITGPFLY